MTVLGEFKIQIRRTGNGGNQEKNNTLTSTTKMGGDEPAHESKG
jgi:hypothetical protein